MTPLRSDPLPQRRHRKMLRDGSSEVWPQEAESIFLDGLRQYWNSPWANFSRGRSRWRNQYLVDYLKKAGIDRSKKQVASHIQVLRNMWKGHPEFCLVAGPDELNGESNPSPTSSHPPAECRRRSTPASSPRRSSIASSPPSTPLSYDSESASEPSSSRRHAIRPSLTLTQPLSLPPQMPPPTQVEPVRVCGLGLWTERMQPTYIDVDNLPSFAPSPPSPLIRTSLRVKLTIPAVGVDAPDNLCGFNGAVSFTSPVPSSTKCLTKVHVDGNCISRECTDLIPVAPSVTPEYDYADPTDQKFAALLPESWLSRCRWLDTGTKKTIVTQQVMVDDEVLFVAIYDLYRVKQSTPSAELVCFNKHIDQATLNSPTGTSAPPQYYDPAAVNSLSSPPTSPRGCAPNAPQTTTMFPQNVDPWATSLLPLF